MQRSLLMRTMAHGGALVIAWMIGLAGCTSESSNDQPAVECCPVGGGCDGFYLGGHRPAGMARTACPAIMDLAPTASATIETDEYGCQVVVETSYGPSCYPPNRDSGWGPPDTGAATMSDASDASADADAGDAMGSDVGDASDASTDDAFVEAG
ncbi:MAG: hypothetical protein JNL79_17540 [Myxococcales bacterium]|nr:hypothetical protein [Myxococcales bacterium]